MLKVEPLSMCGVTRVGRCNINLSNEVSGEARVNLPLELSLPADPFKWTKRQTQNWLCWLREANDLELLDITHFNVDGPGLCSLSPQMIEDMVGIRAGNIFRSTLDLLQSTAALVRHSPAAEQSHSPFDRSHFSPEQRQMSPNPRQLTPEEQKPRAIRPSVSNLSPSQLVNAPESPALTISPPPLSLHYTDRLPLHYQTPGEIPTYNRSSVITVEDIARLQPVAGNTEELVSSLVPEGESTAVPAAKIERRRSSDSSVEGEEDKLNRKYFLNVKTERRPSSNGIDCGRQGVTLWQFILELLADESCHEIVTWTENQLEFKVMNSKEMAIRWGNRKNRPKMNYDKLSRALRYYYRKNLIQHVPGKRQVYFFVEHPESLDFTQLLNNALATHPARTRKQSAFTHVNSRSGLKRPPGDDLLSEIKKGRTMEPLSMLGYNTGRGTMPQLLTLQSPLIAQHLPKLLLQQGSLDLLRQGDRISLPDQHRSLEELMMSSAVSSASNPTLMTSLMTQAQLPSMSMPTEDVLHKISVLDTGCVKGVY